MRVLRDPARTYGNFEHEPVMGQAARQDEQVEQFMDPEAPRPEHGPAEQVEHRPHAIEQATGDEGPWAMPSTSRAWRILAVRLP